MKCSILGNNIFFIKNIQIKYSGTSGEKRFILTTKIREGYLEELTLELLKDTQYIHILRGCGGKGVSEK